MRGKREKHFLFSMQEMGVNTPQTIFRVFDGIRKLPYFSMKNKAVIQ
jgi:hypothetical protein